MGGMWDWVDGPDYASMYDDYCLAMDKQYEAEEAFARYLISFDDDGCTDIFRESPCQMDDGDPDVGLGPGCELCHHKETQRLIRELQDIDWLTLATLADAPEGKLVDVETVQPESLARLLRVGFAWHAAKGWYWISPTGLDELNAYHRMFCTDDIPF